MYRGGKRIKMVNQAAFGDSNMLISSAAGPQGQLQNRRKFLLGWLTTHFPHWEGKTESLNGCPPQNKIISFPTAKTTGNLRIKGWQAFYATNSCPPSRYVRIKGNR